MKRILVLLLTLCLVLGTSLTVFGEEILIVHDRADLLDDAEERALIERLEALPIFVSVVTTDSLLGKSPMEYADDFYDTAYGHHADGVLLLISTEDNDWWISTCGYGIRAFTDAGISYIGDQIVPYLSDGEYAEAFDVFADLCEDFVRQAQTGDPYDRHNLPKAPVNYVMIGVISVVVGLVIAFIVTEGMKKQLKARMQSQATSYVKKGSMQVDIHRDIYLYSTITRRRRENQGGSSTHRSSSGRSHGGGGGKF